MKVVISGSPGSGKTSVINALSSMGYLCFEEVSRTVIQWGDEKGFSNYFLEAPEAFTQKIWTARVKQYQLAAIQQEQAFSFLDRGLHDALAYLHYLNQTHPQWEKQLQKYPYDAVFLLPPWEAIYTSDTERLEDFNTAEKLYPYLEAIYKKHHAKVWEVPFGSVEKRMDFILKTLADGNS